MATFEYSAMTASDRLMKGIIEAGSVQEASELLEQMRLKVNSLEKAKSERPKTPIARTEFLLFNQQLASLTKAGIPLEQGLRELSKDVASAPTVSGRMVPLYLASWRSRPEESVVKSWRTRRPGPSA